MPVVAGLILGGGLFDQLIFVPPFDQLIKSNAGVLSLGRASVSLDPLLV